MRNSAIGCACLLAVFEGVGIAMQRMFAQGPVVLPLSRMLDSENVRHQSIHLRRHRHRNIYSYVISPHLAVLLVFVV